MADDDQVRYCHPCEREYAWSIISCPDCGLETTSSHPGPNGGAAQIQGDAAALLQFSPEEDLVRIDTSPLDAAELDRIIGALEAREVRHDGDPGELIVSASDAPFVISVVDEVAGMRPEGELAGQWASSFDITQRARTGGTLLRRWVATMVDGVIGYCIFVLVRFFVDGYDSFRELTIGAPSGLATTMAIAMSALYGIAAVAIWSKTPGKAVAGLVVERASDGGRPGWRGALLRYGALAVPGLVADIVLSNPARDTFTSLYFLVLCASIVLGEGHRGIHDRFANTVVVTAPDFPGEEPVEADAG